MGYAQGQQSGAFRFNEARLKEMVEEWKPMFSNWLEKWRKHFYLTKVAILSPRNGRMLPLPQLAMTATTPVPWLR
jgi:hypothetical protein